MKLSALALLLASSLAFAQQRSPSTGHSGGARSPGFSGSRPVRPPPNRVPPPPIPHPAHNNYVSVPYPVFYGGYYAGSYYGGDSGAYTQQPAPAYDYGYTDVPGQSPVTMLGAGAGGDPSAQPYDPDQNYRRPDDQPTIYLLALTDHTIIPCIAYWVDGDTLNYITTEASQNRVSLSLIDRDFSISLNDSRGVEFKLPAPK